MLYDPKWEKTETKADPLSLAALVDWLEQQPADATYCYEDTGRYLAAQYNASIGRKYEVVMLHSPYGRCEFDITLEQIGVQKPRTFGAALERARAAVR